jgi:hypothetical protein
VVAEQVQDDRAEALRQLLALQHVVDDDLDRPRLEDVRAGFDEGGEDRDRERLPLRPQQAAGLTEARPAQ